MAATFKQNKQKAREYCKTYSELISDRVLQPPPILLKSELAVILGNDSRRLLYLEGENKNDFFAKLADFREGRIDADTQQFTDRINALKKEQLEYSKIGYTAVNKYVQTDAHKSYPTFDLFLEKGLAKGERRKEIVRYLAKHLGNNVNKAAKFVERHLRKTPHVSIALRVNPALTYYYHVLKKAPKRGDIFDCGYFVCLATVDALVSDDQRARDLFQLICPKKRCFSLLEFMESI